MSENVKTDLLLASQSPRRRELLTQIGVQFCVVSVDVPELKALGEFPAGYVSRLALDKASAGYKHYKDEYNCPVLGADTIVVFRDEVLEKPSSKEHAQTILVSLSGSTHEVITAVAITNGLRTEQITCSTWVTFREISLAEIDAYWKTGEPRDKAGAYGIQGYASVFVKRIEGSYSNVVGLPLFETNQLLSQFEIPIWSSYLEDS